jgi:hypothetical protein
VAMTTLGTTTLTAATLVITAIKVAPLIAYMLGTVRSPQAP